MMSTLNVDEVLGKVSLTKSDFRMLGLMPLLHVAYSDGKVQFAEAHVIRRFGEEKGWLRPESEGVFHEWLQKSPPKELLEQGSRIFASLARDKRGLGTSVPEESIASVVLCAHEVMKASGGLFGFRSPICAAEEAAMEEILQWLGVSSGGPWREVVETLAQQTHDEIPGSEGAFVLGKAREMLSDPLDLLVTTWQRFGDVSRLKMGPNMVYLIVHPDDVQQVLVNNARNYARDDVAFKEVENLLGRGLLTMDGEDWRKRRKLMQPAFHHQKLQAMAGDMVTEVSSMLDRFEQAQKASTPIDVAEETSLLALNVVNRCLLRTNAKDGAVFLEAMPILLNTIAHRSRSVLRVPDAIPTPMNQRYGDALTAVNQVVNTTIAARRKEGSGAHDLLSMLLDARDEESGEGLNDAELRNEVLTLLIAGHETTAVGLSWAFYLLSKHPTVQRELRAEIDRVLEGRAPQVADLPKLPYTNAVIEEAMRLYPPAVMNFRKAIGEDRLSGYAIPAGATLWMSPYLTHRHPKFWTNPQGFDPQRFMPEEAKKQHACAYLPFSAGPRKCIGYQFAMMEMQLALAMATQRFTLDLVPGFEPEQDVGFTLRARDGIWMTVRAAPSPKTETP